MVLQAFVSLVYGVIQGSWIVSAVAVKYILALQLVYAYRSDGDMIDNFREEVNEYSREIVSFIVVLGVLVSLTGIDFTALFEPVSYLVAVVYFGYLFWQF